MTAAICNYLLSHLFAESLVITKASSAATLDLSGQLKKPCVNAERRGLQHLQLLSLSVSYADQQ